MLESASVDKHNRIGYVKNTERVYTLSERYRIHSDKELYKFHSINVSKLFGLSPTYVSHLNSLKICVH